MTKMNKKIAIGLVIIIACGLGFIFFLTQHQPDSDFNKFSLQSASQPYTRFAPDVVSGNLVTLKKLREEYFIDFNIHKRIF